MMDHDTRQHTQQILLHFPNFLDKNKEKIYLGRVISEEMDSTLIYYMHFPALYCMFSLSEKNVVVTAGF